MIEYLNGFIESIKWFHQEQFSNKSQIQFTIFPSIVHGLKDKSFYDKDFRSIQVANPIEDIENELNNRLFSKGGDLYDDTFIYDVPNSYTILMIVYIAGSVPKLEDYYPIYGLAPDYGQSVLIFSPVVDKFFVSINNPESLIYHELLHAMGVPEQYDLQDLEFVRDDVMGIDAGGFRLQDSYIGEDIKFRMGLDNVDRSLVLRSITFTDGAKECLIRELDALSELEYYLLKRALLNHRPVLTEEEFEIWLNGRLGC